MDMQVLNKNIKEISKKLRIDIIKMIWQAGSGHLGGSLSLVEIMAVLYFHHLNINPANPCWEDRDRLVLSKGHAAPVLYACLANKGFFPYDNLATLRRMGSILQGHPDMNKTPGVDITTGCLGEGLSAGIGMALGGMLTNKKFWTYVILGDGETQEGQIWEAAMYASALKTQRLVAIVDNNGCMCDDFIEPLIPMKTFIDKWIAFEWIVKEIDGHDINQIIKTLNDIKKNNISPVLINAKTCKGKGISFMENNPEWHGRIMNEKEYYKALSELGV